MSENFECTKCGKKFKFKCYLDRHLDNKRNCELDNITDDGLLCTSCNRHYATRYNLTRHLKTCKGNNQIVNTTNNTTNNTTTNNITNNSTKFTSSTHFVRSF